MLQSSVGWHFRLHEIILAEFNTLDVTEKIII